MPGCRVDESVREIKRGPGDLAPALVLPCYDGAASSSLLDGGRYHVPATREEVHQKRKVTPTSRWFVLTSVSTFALDHPGRAV